MYIDVTVNGYSARLLLDTGGIVSLISCKLFYTIAREKRPIAKEIS